MAGFLSLAVVLDVFRRRIVGWCMRDTRPPCLVIDARHMAATPRRATDVIHHSDQRSPYRACAVGPRCTLRGVRPSRGSRGDADDPAMVERFFATLEVECLANHRFTTHTEARLAIFRTIEGGYNPNRRHSARGQRSPTADEQAYAVPSRAA